MEGKHEGRKAGLREIDLSLDQPDIKLIKQLSHAEYKRSQWGLEYVDCVMG